MKVNGQPSGGSDDGDNHANSALVAVRNGLAPRASRSRQRLGARPAGEPAILRTTSGKVVVVVAGGLGGGGGGPPYLGRHHPVKQSGSGQSKASEGASRRDHRRFIVQFPSDGADWKEGRVNIDTHSQTSSDGS